MNTAMVARDKMTALLQDVGLLNRASTDLAIGLPTAAQIRHAFEQPDWNSKTWYPRTNRHGDQMMMTCVPPLTIPTVLTHPAANRELASPSGIAGVCTAET